MRNGILCSTALWLSAVGAAAAQAPGYYPSPYPPPYPVMYRPAPYPTAYPPAPHAYGYGAPMAQQPGVMIGNALSSGGQTALPWFRNTHPMAQPLVQGDAPTAVAPPLPEPRTSAKSEPATAKPRPTLIRRVAGFLRPTEGSSAVKPLPSEGGKSDPSLPDAKPKDRPPQGPPYSGPDYAAPVAPPPAHSHGPQCTDGHCADDGWCPPFLRMWHGEEMPRRAPKGYTVYGGIEYLFWFIDEQELPPILAAGPTLIQGEVPGDNSERQGARFTVGVWLDPSNTLGLEASGFFLGERTPSSVFGPGGVARVVTPAGAAAPLLLPVTNARIDAASRLWGGEARLRGELARGCHARLDMLLGVRYLNLDEDITISDLTVAGGQTTSRLDSFDTRNEFFGGLIGLEGEIQWHRFFVNAWGKCALGVNRQEVNINGSTVVTGPGGAAVIPVGVLTGPTNIRSDGRNEFTAIPEFGITVGYCITDQVRVSGGYNFLFISNVVRPDDQIDPFVGGGRPLFLFRDEDFWAHGFIASLEVRF